MADDMPAYYRLYADVWQAVNELPRAKAAKLLYAMAEYFFEGTEPDESELPAASRAMFNLQKANIASYRRNALNGTRNRTGKNKTDHKTDSKPMAKTTQKKTPKTNTVLKGSNTPLPAETQKVGGKHSGKHPAKSASNISNHKSISPVAAALLPRAEQGGGVSGPTSQNRDPLGVVQGEPPRATAGAAKERPAAALASWAELMGRERKQAPSAPVPPEAEWRRVARILETQGLDALTESDRATYSAGHKAYAAEGVRPEP